MSFVTIGPESVAATAASLEGIGSTLADAVAAAVKPITGIAAAGADEVSVAISELFGTYGAQFQAVNAQSAVFHAEFVRLLDGSAAAYLGTEIANAGQSFMTLENAGGTAVLFADRVESSGLAARKTGVAQENAYGQLASRTANNLQLLNNAWNANPAPLARQFLANQQAYSQYVTRAISNAIANLPETLADLPRTLPVAIVHALSVDAPYYLQQFVATQLGFGQTAAASVTGMANGFAYALPEFGSQLQSAGASLLAGEYSTAASDIGTGIADLLVIDTSYDSTFSHSGSFPYYSGTGVMNIRLIGPLGDFFTLMSIPGHEAQYLTNLTGDPVLRQMAQNGTNLLKNLTTPTIRLTETMKVTGVFPPTMDTSLDATFGLPLILAYAAAGGPYSAVQALATSAEAFADALSTGNVLGAVGAVADTPAHVLDGYLNGQYILDHETEISTGLPHPLPTAVTITMHLPFDGILVPPHTASATIDPHLAPAIHPFDVTAHGTPYAGIFPLIVNYIPQQLAMAIKPAA